MAQLTAGNLTTLRGTQHRAKFYLSVSQPEALLTAAVDSITTQGATAIDYTSGTGSGYSRIAAGQTLKVITAYGDKYVRVRAVTGSQAAGTLTVAANDIVWADAQIITVLEEYRLWQLVNRIYPKSGSGVFYKDTDIAYSDQNDLTPPVCLAGPHRVGFLSAGSFDFTVDLSDSYVTTTGTIINTTSLSASPSTGISITDNGDRTYDVSVTAAGQYWLKATATDFYGKSQTTYRRVFAHDANTMPFTEVDIDTLTGDWARGGWTANLTLNSSATETDIGDNTLVVLWMEANYYIGGATGGENILFAGYVQAESIQHDWDKGQVRFRAATVDQRLNEMAVYDLSLAVVPHPDFWYQYAPGMTTALAILHLFKWHSTLLEIADVIGIREDTLLRKFAEIPAGSIGQMARKLSQQRQARMVCNAAGQMVWQLDAQMLNATDRAALTTAFTTTAADSIGQRVISASQPKLSGVNVSGLAFDGAEISAHCAIAPLQDVLAPGSGNSGMSDAVVADDTHAAELAGRLLADGNNPYPEVRLQYHGGYCKVFDITPAEWVLMDVAAGDTPRGIVWDSKRLLPRRITLRPVPATGSLTVDVNFDTEAVGPDGISVSCPTGYSLDIARGAPLWEQTGNAGEGVSGTYAMVTFGANGAYFRNETATDWTAINDTLQAGDVAADTGTIDPWWWTPYKNATTNAEDSVLWRTATAGKLFVSSDGGSAWADVSPTTDPPNSWSDATAPTVADLTITCIAPNYFDNGQFFALAEYNTGSVWRGWLLSTADDGISWTYTPIFTGAAPTESRPLWAMVDQQAGAVLWLTVFRDDNLYLQKWTISAMTFTETDLGAATTAEMEAETYTAAPFAPFGDANLVFVYGRMADPAGLTGAHHVVKSTDGASTWANVENGWSTDRCLSFYAGADNGGNREYYAVRSG